MKIKRKEIFVFLSIFVLIGASLVSAETINFESTDKPTLRELINKWEEIRNKKDELHDLLESYGVDVPDLTDEQEWEIWSTVWRLRKNGASREEIRSEVKSLLESFGVEFPNLSEEDKKDIKQWIKNLLEDDYGFVFQELTQEEKIEIREEIRRLRREGLNREQIRQEVKELLIEEYGFILPDLTEEERKEIREKIKNMLETEYDLDLPDLTDEQREIVREKRAEIKELQRELRRMLKNSDRRTKYLFYRYVKNEINPPPENKNILSNKPILRLYVKILSKIFSVIN